MTVPLLTTHNVHKGFFGNPVLKGVSIDIVPGRVHALLGENGAGKSTLINIMTGVLKPDEGSVEIDGENIINYSPSKATQLGIAVVQQELSLSPELSIAENIGLGAYPKDKLGLIDYKSLEKRCKEITERLEIHEALETPVEQLSLGRRQMVEIAKALFSEPRILILDEPTSSLAAQEASILFREIKNLVAKNIAILFISHRLNEIFELCNFVTVLRDGAVSANQTLDDVDSAGLVTLMIGREESNLFPQWKSNILKSDDDTIFSVKNLSAGAVRDVTLSAQKGEVLGIGGLAGQGQEDFVLALYGALSAKADKFKIGDISSPFKSVAEANHAGLSYTPADRKKEGLVLSHSIYENLLMPSLAKSKSYKKRNSHQENTLINELTKKLSILGDTGRLIRMLSGGNQQKVALAKWLPLNPQVLLLNDPTRGVDIQTKKEIYSLLRQFSEQGRLVILLSSDTMELIHCCDRVAVFREGKLVKTIKHENLNEKSIVSAAMGIASEGTS